MPESLLLNKEQTQELVGLSDSTIYRLEIAGKFPMRRKLSARRVGWLRAEVEVWLESLESVKPNRVL